MKIRFWLFLLLATVHFAVYLGMDVWLYEFGTSTGTAWLWNAARLLGAPFTRPLSDLDVVNFAPVYNSLFWGLGLERGVALWRHHRRPVEQG